jgi:hypothetical protein
MSLSQAVANRGQYKYVISQCAKKISNPGFLALPGSGWARSTAHLPRGGYECDIAQSRKKHGKRVSATDLGLQCWLYGYSCGAASSCHCPIPCGNSRLLFAPPVLCLSCASYADQLYPISTAQLAPCAHSLQHFKTSLYSTEPRSCHQSISFLTATGPTTVRAGYAHGLSEDLRMPMATIASSIS